MIGAGVFLSAGFMAQDLGPGLILIAWSIGALLAIAGGRAYAELATIVPRSGGEYRFLSDLLHPALGNLAGWASLLIAPLRRCGASAANFSWIPCSTATSRSLVTWQPVSANSLPILCSPADPGREGSLYPS